jgi:GntR family transcriptional regulator
MLVALDRNADRALYRQLADLIREQIISGALAPGQDLPSEAALAYEHNVGRDTVRDALAVLRAEGLIVTERGRPAYVTDPGDVDTVTLGPGDTIDVRGGTVVVTRSNGVTETYAAGAVRIIGAGDL